ncbi:hypothetical protein CEP54_014954 [Fusarium duplospermum]|uniref:SnoaL-like domain-containing protein n=1 Tax=Fusarium duplospermum TaxID=1325734 RepID=A0A428NSI8_9HYPO|nr:hypothetical protein CEP54_014954 [Fusarium duplospermum]
MVLLSGIILAIASTVAALHPYASPITPVLSCDRAPHIETLGYQTALHAIQHLLSRYPVAVDGKDWDALPRIFTSDATANFPPPLGTIRGAGNIAAAISDGVGRFVSTQHSYGTQVIELCSNRKAVALTYLTASHFLAQVPPGLTDAYDLDKVLYSYGRYQDTVIKGKDGKWKISERTLVWMGPNISKAFR